ncbi:MAG: CPBP family intramembrane glutamic endopeptidase [Candidatus Limnocylindrales bacterium]
MTAARRYLPTDPADFARSAVPLALLIVAAAVPQVTVTVVIALAAGAAVAISRGAPVRWAWAAAVPVALSLFWGGFPAPAAAVDVSDCANPASPVATWRAVEALIVLLALAAIALALKASPASLSMRMPARRWVRWAILGFVVSGPLALLVGPYLARPFFGDVGYDLVAAALVPALMFAVANGVMEEVIYRGALLGWSARVMGLGPALVGQAIVFGVAHSGSDVIGLQIPLMVALGVGGLLAGIIAVRTRSLLIPIAIHIGLDIPIYFALACPT